MLPFLDDFQSANLGSESNEINYFDQFVALGKNHSDDDESVYLGDYECPGASSNLLVSHEYFTLDLESDSVKKDVIIKTSSLPHYPMCSIVCDVSTCDKDTS